MAVIFIEGFDKYGPYLNLPGFTGDSTNPSVRNLITEGDWTFLSSLNTVAAIYPPLGPTGYALGLEGGPLTRTLPSSYSRLIGGVRIQSSLASNSGIVFLDNTSFQCSITINQGTGLISVRNGDYLGTIIATSTVAVTAGVTHFVEWDISFGASASYTVYLDGVSILSGTGNTKTTSNSSANLFGFQCGIASSLSTYYDDVYLFDSSGSRNNSVLLTNPRVETRYPTSDSQTQWTNTGNVLVPFGVAQTAPQEWNYLSNSTIPANCLVLLQVKAPVNCTLNSISVIPAVTASPVKFKAVLYADTSNAPSTLIATGTEVIGCTIDTTLTLPFASGQALTAGTFYWIGLINNTSFALRRYDTTTHLAQSKTNVYTYGAPTPAGTMTTGVDTVMVWGNATGATTNWESVGNNPATDLAGDNSSIQSSTVGAEDLYGFPPLASAATSIYVVAVKAHTKRSDTGARTVDLRLKSGTTDSGGSLTGQTPSVSYSWLSSYFETDPATGSDWTETAANNCLAGPKIAS
jgi:hypothetical protein